MDAGDGPCGGKERAQTETTIVQVHTIVPPTNNNHP